MWHESVSFSDQEGSAKYCWAIHQLNCVAHLAFCERSEETGKTFNNVIFTDEWSIWVISVVVLTFKSVEENQVKSNLLLLFVGRLAMTFIEEKGINYWPIPAEIPDLNPIEMHWHELKDYLRSCIKPSNKEELVRGIQEFWQTVTPEKCTRYIGHLEKVVPAVVSHQGKASGY